MWWKICKKKYTSAIVALWFDPQQIKKLNIKHDFKKEYVVDNQSYHITLMYLGDLSDIGSSKKLIENIVKNIADNFSKFKVEIGGVAKFFKQDNNSPCVFIMNAFEIEPLRLRIMNAMNSIGVYEPNNAESFIPHMTLGYLPDEEDLQSISLSHHTLDVQALTLSWGGDLKHFQLKG